MRHRVEDLGRIAVFADQLLDLPVCNLYSGRLKDFEEYFKSLSEERQSDILHELIYGIDSLKDGILLIREVSRGEDLLNQPPE